MSTLRKLLALSTVVILASLTACGGGTTSPPSSSAPASKPPTSQAPASSPIANPPATSAAPKAQVRIGGILADLHQLPFFVAQEKGFLAEEGIELKMAGPFADGPTVMNALQANEIDMGYAGVSVAVTAAARKVEVSIVAGSNNEGTAVIADKSINSVADLKGKTVALPAAGSMQHILMGMLLAKNNMTFNDVNIILGTIKYPDMPGALETGKINAYMAPEPFAAQGVVRGVGKVLTTSAEMWPDHPC